MIIILVSTFMSQSDVVLSLVRNTDNDNSSLGNLKPEKEEGNHALSTIQFDIPQLQNISSSITSKENTVETDSIDENNGGKNRGEVV